jgi:hypothetical protein
VQYIVYYKTATGQITGSAVFEDEDLVATITDEMEVDESYMVGDADSELDYITFPGGVPTVTARPYVSESSAVAVVADNTTTIDFALPTGTVVTYLADELTSVAGEHFQFKSNGIVGVFIFTIEPPFPYIPLSPFTVTVNAV